MLVGTGCFMAKCYTLIDYIRQTEIIRLNNTIDFSFLEKPISFAIMSFSRFWYLLICHETPCTSWGALCIIFAWFLQVKHHAQMPKFLYWETFIVSPGSYRKNHELKMRKIYNHESLGKILNTDFFANPHIMAVSSNRCRLTLSSLQSGALCGKISWWVKFFPLFWIDRGVRGACVYWVRFLRAAIAPVPRTLHCCWE